MARTTAIRGAAALLAVLGALALVLAERDRRDCERATNFLLFARTGPPSTDLRPAVADLIDRCRGSEPLVTAAAALVRSERAEAALPLAREAARREPESYSAQSALAAVAAGPDPGGAARARERALELNPLAGRAGP